MAYNKTNWENRIVEYPNRYKDQNNNTLILTQDPGEVTKEGTLVNSARLNNMEDGIYKAQSYKMSDILYTNKWGYDSANDYYLYNIQNIDITKDMFVDLMAEYSLGESISVYDGGFIIYVKEQPSVDISIEYAYRQTWEGTGTIVTLDNVTNLSAVAGNGKVTLTWTDPNNKVLNGQTITWSGTKVIQKLGSYPTSVTDGIQVLDSKVKNQYSTNGFTVNNLTNDLTYYFGVFPYDTNNNVNTDFDNVISAKPVGLRTMTVNIDTTNSNPSTCITYADDAVGMTPGSSAWDTFFKHYPCLFKDGAEVGKLNPNNFAQFEDGTAADITSGNAGDVMIAFPRLGVKISTSGNTLTVSMTDDPNAQGFTYYAHQRGTTLKDKFYLGAYKGYEASSKLRSLSGKTITASKTIGAFRTSARKNGGSDGNGGSGYDQSGFYQLVFRQCMYLLKYKNLDSQTAVGRGYVDGNSAATKTGNTDAKGMDWGETTGKQQMKLFGLEDFWGNVYEWIDGLFCNLSRKILTATQGFNDTGSGYTDQGSGGSSNVSGYMNVVQGTSEKGFVIKTGSGSQTTYWCDWGFLGGGYVPHFGGSRNNGSDAGAFHLYVASSASESGVSIAARLMYL